MSISFMDPRSTGYLDTLDNNLIDNTRSDSLERQLLRRMLYLQLTELEFEVYYLRYERGKPRRTIAIMLDKTIKSINKTLDRVNEKVDKIIIKLNSYNEREEVLRDYWND